MIPKKRRKQGEEKPGRRRRQLMDLEAREMEDELRLAKASADDGDEGEAPPWKVDEDETEDTEVISDGEESSKEGD